MANDKITVQIDLEKGDVKTATTNIQKDVSKAGTKAGLRFGTNFKKSSTSALKGLGNLLRQNIGLVAGFAAAFGVRSIVQAANKQEDAVNRLNNALKTSNSFSEEASQSFQKLAANLQTTSRFGDEVILDNIALAKSFGATNEQAEDIIQASIDLAAAFKIDLQSATRNVSKTLGGFAGELGETIPELKNLTKEQLQAGAGVELLAERYNKAGERDIKTFSAATEQLSNAFSDLLEKFGSTITTSNLIVNAIKGIIKFIRFLTDNFDTFLEVLNSIQVGFLTFAQVITKTLLPLGEFVVNIFNTIVRSVGDTFFDLFSIVTGTLKKISDAFSFFGVKSDLQDSIVELDNLVKTSNANREDLSVGLFDFSISKSINDSIDSAKAALNNRNNVVKEANEELKKIVTGGDEGEGSVAKTITNEFKTVADVFQLIADQFTEFPKAAKMTQEALAESNEKFKKFAKESGKAVRQDFAKAVGAGFKEIGRALITGENGLENFGKVLIKQIGQTAVTLGTNFILQGAAALFSLNPAERLLAPGLLAGGAALATFGGALGASAGGDSGGATSGGAGGGTTAPGVGLQVGETTEDLSEPEAIAEKQTRVSINVEGSLVRQEELGSFISDVLSESNAKNSNIITDFRTA